MDQQNTHIGILAGNSRVYLDNNGMVAIEAQLNAFDAALRLTRQSLDSGNLLPKLSVAFDHLGIFRLQFLTENLSNAQKRRPRLSHLHPLIQQVFLPIAEKYQIDLSDIRAIHEDSARQHLVHILATQDIPERLTRRMLTGAASRPNGDTHNETPTQKLTCAAITKEYFERAASDHQDPQAVLEVFFENSPWSRSLAYVRGLQLSHLLGVPAAIRLNLVNEVGEVSRGEKIIAQFTSAPKKPLSSRS